MKRRWLTGIALAGLVYALLLLLLLAAESANPQASIRSFSDALWYSLVTLTTVGYGDLYPLSPLGRVIGLFFVLLSIGALASLIGALMAFLRQRVLPALRLSALQRSDCYLFSACNEPALALARDLARAEPQACFVFCRETERPSLGAPLSPRRVFCVPQAITDLAPRLGGAGKRAVFLIGQDPMGNYAAARRLCKLPLEICCFGPETDDLPGVRFFSAASGIARAYWAAHPLAAEERIVLVQGSGSLAREILNQAILVACREPFQRTVYHLFGDWTDYQREHPQLAAAFSSAEGDALLFHHGPWTAQPDLLAQADRLILCQDDFARNGQDALRLLRYLPLGGPLHVAAAVVPAPAVAFGAAEETYTGENVLQSALDARAKTLHGLYCRMAGQSEDWDGLPPFLKMSNRASADHLLTKLRLLLPEKDVREITPEICQEAARRWRQLPDRALCRRNEHLRWTRFYALYNWRYGPEKDAARRTHPCLVPYEQLSREDQEKDDNAWLQIELLAGKGAQTS